MKSLHFSTQILMRSGIPHIALSSISAEKQYQADREFSMRVDVAGFILSTLSRTIAQRFSMGDILCVIYLYVNLIIDFKPQVVG